MIRDNWKHILYGLLILTFISFPILGIMWSSDIQKPNIQKSNIIGVPTVSTVIFLSENLLNKPGGYLNNDINPISLWIDNMPNFEKGYVVLLRDITNTLRNKSSRNQSQAIEDKNLAIAEPRFQFSDSSWIFPMTENVYREGISELETYLNRITDKNKEDGQFFTRAIDMKYFLDNVSMRLGSYSQRLNNSVFNISYDTSLEGEPDGEQSTPTPKLIKTKTNFFDIDDVFYESRGYSFALLYILKSMELDFRNVLIKKNATNTFGQIIKELEYTQKSIWTPIVAGDGFNLPNQSLVLSSYLSRANAAINNLKELLDKG